MVMSTKDTKPRGYAFIEYEHEKDMHCKYLMWKTDFGGFYFVVMVCFKCVSLESSQWPLPVLKHGYFNWVASD